LLPIDQRKYRLSGKDGGNISLDQMLNLKPTGISVYTGESGLTQGSLFE
jgi:hypothetical protein